MDRALWLDPRTGRITFAEWVERWLASNPSRRATTQARDLTVLRTHFLPTLGTLPLAAIAPAHVKATVDAMTAKLAPATLRTNLGVLRAVLNAAVDADEIAKSPVRGVRAKVTGRAVLRIVERLGCARLRQRGSHVIVRCPGGCQTVVPGEHIPAGTLRAIEGSLEPCLGKG